MVPPAPPRLECSGFYAPLVRSARSTDHATFGREKMREPRIVRGQSVIGIGNWKYRFVIRRGKGIAINALDNQTYVRIYVMD